MVVCANRTDDPGSFTSCHLVGIRRCVCGDQVRDQMREQIYAAASQAVTPDAIAPEDHE